MSSLICPLTTKPPYHLVFLFTSKGVSGLVCTLSSYFISTFRLKNDEGISSKFWKCAYRES